MHSQILLLDAAIALAGWIISTSATLLFLRWRQKEWEKIVKFYVESTSEALTYRIEALEANCLRFISQREVSQRFNELIRDLRELRRTQSELINKYVSGRRG